MSDAGGANGYVVGADGGNSKTDLVLAAVDGTILARRQVRGTTPQRDGMSATMRALADAVRAAAADAGVEREPGPAAGVFCLANVDTAEDEVEARAELTRLGVAAHVVVRNDTYAVLRPGHRRHRSRGRLRRRHQRRRRRRHARVHRFLGLGPESGDWGGAERSAWPVWAPRARR